MAAAVAAPAAGLGRPQHCRGAPPLCPPLRPSVCRRDARPRAHNAARRPACSPCRFPLGVVAASWSGSGGKGPGSLRGQWRHQAQRRCRPCAVGGSRGGGLARRRTCRSSAHACACFVLPARTTVLDTRFANQHSQSGPMPWNCPSLDSALGFRVYYWRAASHLQRFFTVLELKRFLNSSRAGVLHRRASNAQTQEGCDRLRFRCLAVSSRGPPRGSEPRARIQPPATMGRRSRGQQVLVSER